MLVVDGTSIALGSIFAEFSKDDLDIVVRWLEKMSIIVESGVQSVGPPAAYSLVWEWGNIRQTKKGPKTVKGTNPDGSSVWLSIQAPRGWISIHEPEIWRVMEEEIGKVEFDISLNELNVTSELQKAYERIAQRCLHLLQTTVPVDSGDLYDSLEIVPVNDATLKELGSLSGDIVNTIGSLNI